MTCKLVLTLSLHLSAIAGVAPFIVKDGRAGAEIALPEDAPRSTHFATPDLQGRENERDQTGRHTEAFREGLGEIVRGLQLQSVFK